MRQDKPISDVEDLHVFQKAYLLSLEIHRKSLELPREEQFELAAQMRRASKSICANLAEGFGKRSVSKAEFKRYLMIAIGSADEIRLWIQYCKDLFYLNKETALKWREEYQNVAKMLTGLYHKWN